ncbi:MAG TPA: hypothetical protein VF509_01990 [Sphingobium sp.]
MKGSGSPTPGYDFDFNQGRRQHKIADNGRSSGFMCAKARGVGSVECDEIGGIFEPDRGLHDIVERQVRRSKDGGDIVNNLPGLPIDVRSRDSLIRIERKLTGKEQEWIAFDERNEMRLHCNS